MDFSESERVASFRGVVRDFVKKVKEIGPLGSAEGLDSDTLKFKLDTVTELDVKSFWTIGRWATTMTSDAWTASDCMAASTVVVRSIRT